MARSRNLPDAFPELQEAGSRILGEAIDYLLWQFQPSASAISPVERAPAIAEEFRDLIDSLDIYRRRAESGQVADELKARKTVQEYNQLSRAQLICGAKIEEIPQKPGETDYRTIVERTEDLVVYEKIAPPNPEEYSRFLNDLIEVVRRFEVHMLSPDTAPMLVDLKKRVSQMKLWYPEQRRIFAEWKIVVHQVARPGRLKQWLRSMWTPPEEPSETFLREDVLHNGRVVHELNQTREIDHLRYEGQPFIVLP